MCVNKTTMNSFKGFLVLFLCFSSQKILVNAHDCDFFTFSKCDVESNLVWQNDQVNFLSEMYFLHVFFKIANVELCQTTCAAISSCNYFLIDHDVCKLYR